MLKNICLQLISVLLISCNSHLADDDEEILQSSTSFSYTKMEFLFDENTTFKDLVKDYPVFIINNYSDIEQSYVDDPQKIFFEKSQFYSSDTRAFSYVDDQEYVKAPLGRESYQEFVYDEKVQWLYTSIEQKRRPIIDRSFPTIKIKPKHRLLVYSHVKLKEIFTIYRVYLKGIEKGEELIIQGTWGGVIFLDYDADYVLEPLVME